MHAGLFFVVDVAVIICNHSCKRISLYSLSICNVAYRYNTVCSCMFALCDCDSGALCVWVVLLSFFFLYC